MSSNAFFKLTRFILSRLIMLTIVLMGTSICFTTNAQNSTAAPPNPLPQEGNNIKTKSTSQGRFIGTMNNIVIFIRFSDQEEFTQSFEEVDKLWNDPDGLSVRHFYAENSNNKFIIHNHFFPRPNGDAIVSYQASHPKAYYDPYDEKTNPIGYQGIESYEREYSLERDAILSVKQELEESGLNFDLNNDGKIDNFTFIIKYDGEGPFSIIHYPHGGNRASGDEVFIGDKKAWGLNVHTTQYLEEYELGFICHEMFHGFSGAPDLYNSDTKASSPVGVWDPMGILTGLHQPHFLVYTKMKYGTWLESIPKITKPGTYTLESVSKNPFAAYEIPSPNSEYESFIVEYRKPGGMFEIGLQNDQIKTGLIIYRVDSRYSGGGGGEPFFEVYIFRPLYGTHPEEGNDDMAGFAIENDKTIFNNKTNPSCFLNDGSDGGIFIANVTSNQGETISFDVIDPYNLISPTALFTAENSSGVFPLSVNFKECSEGFPTSFNWDFGDGQSSTERHPNHTYDLPGKYSVSLEVSNSEGTNKIVKTDIITVSKKEQSITFADISEAHVDDVTALNATASSGLEVSFSVISGDATINSENSTITFNSEGDVEIMASQQGDEEYNAAPEKTITVSVSIFTGINGISDNSISIYPIPMKSILNIKADKCYKIQLIDIMGKVKLQHQMEDTNISLNTNNLSSGVYILRLIDNGNNVINRRILKK